MPPRSDSLVGDGVELVIDADVMRAAATLENTQTNAVDPCGSSCTKFLLAVHELGFAVLLSQQMQDEWRKHQMRSRFARTWWVWMAARKCIRMKSVGMNTSLRNGIRRVLRASGLDDIKVKEAEKDIHLLEAARASGNRVCSRDQNARLRFRRAATKIREIQRVAWVDPTIEEDCCCHWLKQGAPFETHRFLGGSRGRQTDVN